jgi:hypothetical protein
VQARLVARMASPCRGMAARAGPVRRFTAARTRGRAPFLPPRSLADRGGHGPQAAGYFAGSGGCGLPKRASRPRLSPSPMTA